jgi:outer membrane protein insertion porin family
LRGFEPNGIGPRDLTAGNEDALGGNIYAVARFEADFPLGLPEEYGITGGAFFDVGTVFGLDDVGTGGEVDDAMHPRAAVGLSVFWTTPIGPLRFNFSKALIKEAYDKEQPFEFTISTKF